MDIDPTLPVDNQTGKFIIICAIDPATKRPFPCTINPVTGEIRVNAEFTGDVIVDIDHPDVLSGKTFTLTGGVDRLPAFACKAGGSLCADGNNVGTELWLGGSDVAVDNGFKLPTGEDVPFTADNLNCVYVIGTAGDKLHYLVG